MARYGDWIMTHTGKQFWPLDPRVEDIIIEDIAHALSNICRYGGHCRRFYSVAEHCVLMSRRVSPQNRLWALLHDATEAYLMDLPRPVKPYFQGYEQAESMLMRCIVEKYHLAYVMPEEVKDADNRIIVDEMKELMDYLPEKYAVLDPLIVPVVGWSPSIAKDLFLKEFKAIQKQ